MGGSRLPAKSTDTMDKKGAKLSLLYSQQYSSTMVESTTLLLDCLAAEQGLANRLFTQRGVERQARVWPVFFPLHQLARLGTVRGEKDRNKNKMENVLIWSMAWPLVVGSHRVRASYGRRIGCSIAINDVRATCGVPWYGNMNTQEGNPRSAFPSRSSIVMRQAMHDWRVSPKTGSIGDRYACRPCGPSRCCACVISCSKSGAMRACGAYGRIN